MDHRSTGLSAPLMVFPLKVVLLQTMLMPFSAAHGTAAAAAFDAILAARSPWLAVRPEATADSPFLRALFLAANPLAGLLPPVLLEQQADIRLASFRDNYPQAMRRIFEVDASPIGRFIVDWTAPEGSLGVDLAVRIGHLPDSTLVARHVGVMPRIVVASPAYLKARGEPKTPEAITSHDTIQFGATPEWRFAGDGREFRLTSTPRFITNSADAAIQHAEQGGGLAEVMAYQAAEAIKGGRLRIVLAKFQQPALPIHIVYPTSRLLSAKVRTFVDLVIETSAWQFG